MRTDKNLVKQNNGLIDISKTCAWNSLAKFESSCFEETKEQSNIKVIARRDGRYSS